MTTLNKPASHRETFIYTAEIIIPQTNTSSTECEYKITEEITSPIFTTVQKRGYLHGYDSNSCMKRLKTISTLKSSLRLI